MFGLKCQQACPERAVGALADDSLIPMIGVISVATAVTMRMTATASARGAVEAGEKMVFFLEAWLCHFDFYFLIFTAFGLFRTRQWQIFFCTFPGPDLGLDLAQGPGPVDAAIDLAHAAVATAGMWAKNIYIVNWHKHCAYYISVCVLGCSLIWKISKFILNATSYVLSQEPSQVSILFQTQEQVRKNIWRSWLLEVVVCLQNCCTGEQLCKKYDRLVNPVLQQNLA